MKIKVNDKVKILSGKDRGKTGKVIQVIFNKRNNENYIVVEGINLLKKHMRAQKRQKGQIIELPSPIHASKAMLIETGSGKPTRVGFKIDGEDKKRISKKTGEYIE